MRRPRVRTTLRSVLRRVGMRSLAVCGGVRGAMRLEVALGHPVDERDEERNHAQAGDQERQEDEQEARDPFPSRQSRRQDRRRNGIADRRRGATGSPGLSVYMSMVRGGVSPGRDRASAGVPLGRNRCQTSRRPLSAPPSARATTDPWPPPGPGPATPRPLRAPAPLGVGQTYREPPRGRWSRPVRRRSRSGSGPGPAMRTHAR